MRPNLMIDLETLGTGPDAAITEVGWAVWDIDSKKFEIIRSGSIMVDPDSCVEIGMKIEWRTIQWWMSQDESARLRFSTPGLSIRSTLLAIPQSIEPAEFQYGVWSHGASFDIPILEFAYRRCGMKSPWNHRVIRDTRTIFDLSPPVWPKNPAKHSAEHDAVAQAGAVQSSLQALKNLSPHYDDYATCDLST